MIMVLIIHDHKANDPASLWKVSRCSDETMMHLGYEFPSEAQPYPDKRREGRVD